MTGSALGYRVRVLSGVWGDNSICRFAAPEVLGDSVSPTPVCKCRCGCAPVLPRAALFCYVLALLALLQQLLNNSSVRGELAAASQGMLIWRGG